MKKNYITAVLGLAALFGLSGLAHGFEVAGGGVPYVAKITPDKADMKSGAAPLVLKTGDALGTGDANHPANTVPFVKSMGWKDNAANPKDDASTDVNLGYGWTHNSKWFLIDLNKLYDQGIRKAYVMVTLKQLNDGAASETDSTGKVLPSDDDLIPGLTVFKGYQDHGTALGWYPNQYQTKVPFWANKLTPFTEGSPAGFATANGTTAQEVTLYGQVKLQKGRNNYLSVALGGDARHATASLKHDVNFQFEVEVLKSKPADQMH
ncbi:hypothetical protein [Methylomagnum sp.]